MIDERINDAAVLRAIYGDETHTIWSPCTTLSRMGIERYPHQPKHNRRAMKSVLAGLHERGLLTRRSQPHSHFTFREVAYERVPGLDVQQATSVLGVVTQVEASGQSQRGRRRSAEGHPRT